jgi:hypothetical protein
MADEKTEATVVPQQTFWQKITNNSLFALIMFVVGIGATLLFITITEIEIVVIVNKLLNFGIVFAGFMLYKFLFNKKSFKNDTKIAEDSIAVALDGGFFILAIALAVTL